MKWNSLLLALCSCLCIDAAAQTATANGSENTARGAGFGIAFNGGNNLIGDKTLRQMIRPVEIVTGKDKVTRAAQPVGRVTSPWNTKKVIAQTDDATKLQLDSVVGYNTDGSKYTLQAFTYNSKGLTTSQRNSYYNSETGTWDLAEEYGYEWTDDGLILDEWGKAYGMGTRRTYVYNDRGWGIEQIIYDLDANGEWVYAGKGEYEYDDNANITAERTYSWDGAQWQPATKAMSEYDDKNRQTYVEGYTWDGTQWTGSVKQILEWCDKPDPAPVDPTNTDRNTLAMSFVWENGKWEPLVAYINEFDTPDGYITMQKICWWNGHNWGGDNGSTSVAFWTYDDHNAITSHEGYICVNDSTAWVKSYEGDYHWTYDSDGNREGAFDVYYMNHDSDYNITGKDLTERYEEAYDRNGQVTWRKIWNINLSTGELEPIDEIKRRYNEYGEISYEASWTWQDGERKPSVENTYTFDADGNVTEQYSRNGGNFSLPLGAPATRGNEIDDADLEGWYNYTHFTYGYENGIRNEKLGYMWTNEQWTTNLGQIVDYDFDYPSESIITPVSWAEPYKIDALHDLVGDGASGWMSAEKIYYWTDLIASGVTDAAVASGIKARLDGNILTVTGADGTTVNVYNAGGTCVASATKAVIDMSGKPAGLYIVKAGTYTTKIIKH